MNIRTVLGPSLIAVVAACGSSKTPPGSGEAPGGSSGSFESGTPDPDSGPGGSFMGGDDSGTPSAALPRCTAAGQCVQSCSGTPTTISGTVYDPAGRNPLYGVVVFVPSSTPAPFPAGASCASCASLYTGDPIAFAVTDAAGRFRIQGAPDGANIPLVVQIGKWRRQLTLPSVPACATTEVPDGTLRLPRNRMEGDIPAIAISTGGADSLECLLGRIGIDASEYGPGPSSPARIHIYQGAGGANTSPSAQESYKALWDSKDDLQRYDVVLLSCEGDETAHMNQQALFDYATAGGRVFASHYHYAWFNTGPFGAENLAKWKTGGNTIADLDAVIETTLPNGQPFPRGQAMKDWLGNVGALVNGELPITVARHNADVSVANTASVPWIAADAKSEAPGATQYFSADTPFGAGAEACGRVVYSDLHVGGTSADYGFDGTHVPSGAIVPTGCKDARLSPQEDALEFMLFDLSACIAPPDEAPTLPVIR
jgi:hypothetical protein